MDLQVDNLVPKFCEKCGTQYTQRDINVYPDTSSYPPLLSIRAECKNCRHVVLLKVAIRPNGSASPSISGIKQIGKNYTSEEDIEFMNTLEPLSEADLLEFFEILDKAKAKDILKSLD